MSMILTQVYLEQQQKKSLAAYAKANGRKASDLMREAIDAMMLGVTVQELHVLDETTKRMEKEIKEINATLDKNAAEHKAFMREMKKLRAAGER